VRVSAWLRRKFTIIMRRYAGGQKMITLHIPEGAEAPNINKEIMSARNIKDRKTRQSTMTGLNKIAHYL